MGCLAVFSIISLLISIIIGYLVYSINVLPELPDVRVTYWGKGHEKQDDKSIVAFKIKIPEEEVKILQEKLAKTRALVPPLEGVGFDYGINTQYLNKFVQFWKTQYNWREREAYLNSLPQFTTQIGGLNIHFIHSKPDPNKAKGKQVLPLLLLHGWPGSVREFYKIIPMLTSPQADKDFVFEIIAPSLPGYGFSEAASKPGMGPAHMGAIFNELMNRLGFEKYFIQGGDWGSLIGMAMSVVYPNKIIGLHLNMCAPQTASSVLRTIIAYFMPSFFIEDKFHELYKNQFFDILLTETGYMHIQATKPDTVGVALGDSPVGLAAYILEKFSTWTNRTYRSLPDGGLETYDKTELLDNIMIYWFTRSITTSMRLYSEAFNKKYMGLRIDSHPVTVPTACARFPSELLYYPDFVLEGAFTNLVSTTDMSVGGHFGAFEQPKMLANDIWSFVKKLRSLKQK